MELIAERVTWETFRRAPRATPKSGQISKIVWSLLLLVVLFGTALTLRFKYKEHQFCKGFTIGISAIGGFDRIGRFEFPPIFSWRVQ